MPEPSEPLTDRERSPWYPLDVAMARRALYPGRVDDLPAAAVTALERGADGVELVVLAGMGGRSWSEVDLVVARIYPGERGEPAPSGLDALALLVDEQVRRVVDGGPRHDAAGAIYRLWADAGYPTSSNVPGDVATLAAYDDAYDLAHSGVLMFDEVDREFRARCSDVLALGGVRVTQDPAGRAADDAASGWWRRLSGWLRGG